MVRRRRAHDVVHVTPGPKNHAAPQTVDDAVYLFCDELFMKIVVDSTNKEMTRQFTEKRRLDDLVLLDTSEANAFLGLLILIGVLRGRREPLQQLWDDKWGRPIFRATMGFNRFKTILRYMRFDDKETRAERRVGDKLAALRELFEHFVNSCRTYYELSPAQQLMNNYLRLGENARSACTSNQNLRSTELSYGCSATVKQHTAAMHKCNRKGGQCPGEGSRCSRCQRSYKSYLQHGQEYNNGQFFHGCRTGRLSPDSEANSCWYCTQEQVLPTS